MAGSDITIEILKAMRKEMRERFDGVDKRFDGVDKRFDAVDQRLNAVDKRFDAADKRFDSVDKRLDRVDVRFATLSASVDERFDAVDVAMVVIVIIRRLCQSSPKVLELCRRSIEFKRKATELDMPRLLGQHDFQKVEIVRSRVVALDYRGKKNRGAVGGSDVVLRPADVLLDKLSEIL